MNVKQYLKKVEKLEAQIQASKELLMQIRSSATSISIGYEERVQSTKIQDQIGQTVAKVVDLEEEIQKKQIELVNFKMEVIRQINRLDDGEQVRILINRYLEHKTLVEISEEMAYAYSTIKLKHGEALKEFARLNGFSC